MLTWDETEVSGLPRLSGVFAEYQIIRRHGTVVPFEPNTIAHAMMSAFMAVHGVAAFTQRMCSGWLYGLWRAIKPSKVSAHAVDRATALDHPQYVASKRSRSRPQGFFGSSKPDMRNAP